MRRSKSDGHTGFFMTYRKCHFIVEKVSWSVRFCQEIGLYEHLENLKLFVFNAMILFKNARITTHYNKTHNEKNLVVTSNKRKQSKKCGDLDI